MAQANEEVAALRAEVADLRAELEQLQQRVGSYDRMFEQWQREHEIDEKTLLVISAAVAAVMGHKAKIRQVHFSRSSSWSSAGRAAVQDRTVERSSITTPLRTR